MGLWKGVNEADSEEITIFRPNRISPSYVSCDYRRFSHLASPDDIVLLFFFSSHSPPPKIKTHLCRQKKRPPPTPSASYKGNRGRESPPTVELLLKGAAREYIGGEEADIDTDPSTLGQTKTRNTHHIILLYQNMEILIVSPAADVFQATFRPKTSLGASDEIYLLDAGVYLDGVHISILVHG